LAEQCAQPVAQAEDGTEQVPPLQEVVPLTCGSFPHEMHAVPPVPHSLGDWFAVTHPVPSQQPLGQEFGLHATQAPPAQIWPVVPQGLPSLTSPWARHAGP
jgi:hypothetical protein